MKKILIAEDDTIIKEILLVRLGGYEVVAVMEKGAEAISRISSSQEKIDLVITDLYLLDGQTGEQVIQAALAGGIPVVLLSGSPEEATIVAEKNGVVFLGKPFSNPELLAAIETAISQTPTI